jgi:type VI secretion system secreted protein VgrG
MAVTQAGRLISVTTPLGADELLLEGFSGQEALSSLFQFTLYLLSDNTSIAFDAVVGKPATIHILKEDGSQRPINGVISHFSQGSMEAGFSRYHAIVVPWLWNLTRTVDCRIFQHKTVPDIIQQIFRDLGYSDFKLALTGNYQPRTYCVQYRETDFNFVSRLMEEEGIFYFFEHSANQHILILGDSQSAHQPCPGQARFPYGSVGGPQQGDSVTGWLWEQGVQPAQYALTDFNFETPSTDLSVNVSTLVTAGRNDRLQIYDYPGRYRKRSEGERYVKLHMEEQETPHTQIHGAGDCRAFVPGYVFQLTDHFRGDFNRSYLLTEVHHEARSNIRGGGSEASYSNTFTCIPKEVPFRPPSIARKPFVQGVQTAIVAGPKGEEIWTDKYGRVKVQFHWDREGKRDENSSCWLRVAQNWAGKRWGVIFTPRIGQEVIVDFLEGDPDQPIITGRVYNAEAMPPYELPQEQTKSTIKSLSSKGGGGFNEIRFEDKKSQEQLFIHAERNQDNRVKNDSLEWVGRDRHLIIKRDQLEQVEGDLHLSVKGDQNEKIDGTMSLQAGMDMQEKVGMKYALDAGMEIHLKAGMNLVIESGATLTLKVGGNFINLNPAGIFISGTMVMLNSGGAAGSGSGASPETPKAPQEADKAEPGQKDQPPPPPPPLKPVSYSPAALAMQRAAQNGTPFCEAG